MQARRLLVTLSNLGTATIVSLCLSLSAACSGTNDGSGGATGSGGKTGSGGSANGGTGTGGSANGGTGTGGSASGGASSGGSPSGGASSGGKTGSGGSASGGTGMGGSSNGGSSNGGGSNGGSSNGGSSNGGATNKGGASAMGGGGGAAMGGSGNGGAPAGGSGGAGSFDPCPASGACKVLPLGDSITFGIQYEGAWRVELFSKAVAAGKKITFVGSQMNGPSMAGGQSFPKNHEGHSGYTIDQMKPYAMTTDVPYMPNMILLHIGTNDTYGSSPSGAPGRLSALVDLITSTYPNALLVVAKIVPYPAQAANVKLINDSIPALVTKNQMAGKHVIMVDCFTGFTTSSMLSSDSIHPNKTGYDFMGDQFYAAVASYLH
ncbi:MAG TPA: SGNH/GDSL hydrolase family protein [Polyangiaceae bacterium]|nr:SGNH/GDSL hydrolase family protein [Polyangiaceae bacterium]